MPHGAWFEGPAGWHLRTQFTLGSYGAICTVFMIASRCASIDRRSAGIRYSGRSSAIQATPVSNRVTRRSGIGCIKISKSRLRHSIGLCFAYGERAAFERNNRIILRVRDRGGDRIASARVSCRDSRIYDAKALEISFVVRPNSFISWIQTFPVGKPGNRLGLIGFGQCWRPISKTGGSLPDGGIPESHAMLCVGVDRVESPDLCQCKGHFVRIRVGFGPLREHPDRSEQKHRR